MAETIEFRVNPKPARRRLERLWREVWQDNALPDFERMIQHGLLHVGAFDADVLVGFANVAHDGAAHAFLSDLCVAPAYQRKGIGSRLAAIAIEQVRKTPATWMHVDHEPHLADFYGRIGFQPTQAGLMRIRR